MRVEQTILSSLIYDEGFTRKVLPFLKQEYFHDQTEKVLFACIERFIDKYNNLPTKETLLLEIEKQERIPEQVYSGVVTYINDIVYDKKDPQWLVDNAEKFCQEKAVYNAIMESISIIDGNAKENDKGSIPTILADALGVTFDDSIGHDFLKDADERFEFLSLIHI